MCQNGVHLFGTKWLFHRTAYYCSVFVVRMSVTNLRYFNLCLSVCLSGWVRLSVWLADRPTDQQNSRFHSAFDCMQLHQCIIAYHPDYYFQCYINCYMCVYVFRVLRICILCGLLLFKWLPLCTCCGFSWVSPVLCLWHLWFSWYFTSHDLEEFLLC